MSKALKAAIEANDPDAVQRAIKGVKDLNRRMPGANTPLLYACERGADKVIDVLLQAGAVAEKKNSYAGDTPFAVAATHGKTGVMERLLALGQASPETVEHTLEDAAMEGRENALKFILGNRKLAITSRLFRLGTMSIRTAPVIKVLIECGGDINIKEESDSEKGTTAMHFVATGGESVKIRALVDCGADVNVRDARGRTPLMCLAAELEWLERSKSEAKATEALESLIDLGADARLTDQFGNGAIAHYEFEVMDPNLDYNGKFVEVLKKAGGQGIGVTGRLFAAIREKDLAAVRAALQAGANVNHVTPKGATPLIWVGDETIGIAKALLDAGADPNKSGIKSTPLISAARCGDIQTVKLLVEAGANLHAVEPEADEPTNAYLAAEIAGEYEVVDYLKSLGAGRPKPSRFEPLKAGVASWNDFSELLVRADATTVARSLAGLIQGVAHMDIYGQSFSPGPKAYVVVRPKGMEWSNVLQVAPPPLRFENSQKIAAFARHFAKAIQAPVLQIEFSDTSDAASIDRFEPDGKVRKDAGWDRDTLEEMVEAMGSEAPAWARKKLAKSSEDEPSSTERLVQLAEVERFVAAAFWIDCQPGRKIDVDFVGYPAEAFDGVAFVTN